MAVQVRVQVRKLVLFGLTGEPLLDAAGLEVESASVEEVLAFATAIKQTPYLRVIEQDDVYQVLLDTMAAQHALLNAMEPEIVPECLRAGAQVDARSKHGWTVLHRASSSGDDCLVEMLLANGADKNALQYNWTPLHFACVHGHEHVVKKLLAADANANVRDNNGWTPLDWASKLGHEQVVELLRAAGGQL